MMMDCGNRKPPANLSGTVVATTAAAAVSSPEPAVAGTWHPHVYGNPPRTPTAHNIADILGWTRAGPDEQPLNLSTVRRPNGTTTAVLDLTKIKRKGTCYNNNVINVISFLLPFDVCSFRENKTENRNER